MIVAAAVAGLAVLVALGLAVKVLSLPCWGVERHTISTRDFPNVAPDLTPKIGAGSAVAPPSPGGEEKAA